MLKTLLSINTGARMQMTVWVVVKSSQSTFCTEKKWYLQKAIHFKPRLQWNESYLPNELSFLQNILEKLFLLRNVFFMCWMFVSALWSQVSNSVAHCNGTEAASSRTRLQLQDQDAAAPRGEGRGGRHTWVKLLIVYHVDLVSLAHAHTAHRLCRNSGPTALCTIKITSSVSKLQHSHCYQVFSSGN